MNRRLIGTLGTVGVAAAGVLVATTVLGDDSDNSRHTPSSCTGYLQLL